MLVLDINCVELSNVNIIPRETGLICATHITSRNVLLNLHLCHPNLIQNKSELPVYLALRLTMTL